MKTKDNAALKRKKIKNQVKALATLCITLALILTGQFFAAALFLLIFYIANEALWSDHIFFNPRSDYDYSFGQSNSSPCVIQQGKLQINNPQFFDQNAEVKSGEDKTRNTVFLKIPIKASFTGAIFDPHVTITRGEMRQTQYFERSLCGQRYINISDFFQTPLSNDPVSLTFRHCAPLSEDGQIIHFEHPDYTHKRILVLAPHADDAELAAFGLYSESYTHITTITAGEVEMEDYAKYYSDPEQASLLKGRLRAWDSLSIPLWGNTPLQNCIQLGYFCLTLKEMSDNPAHAVHSRTANLNSTQPFRQFNQETLASDNDNTPSWNNLTQDLAEIIDKVKPDVIVTPHPELDPHQDHLYTTKAVSQVLPENSAIELLLYANHYRSTDHFAFGPANSNVGLPPNFENDLLSPKVYSHSLEQKARIDKALSLEMMHDLKSSPSLKKQLRRKIQHWLCRRDYFRYGDNAFFSKTVKQHEVFITCSVPELKECLRSDIGHH